MPCPCASALLAVLGLVMLGAGGSRPVRAQQPGEGAAADSAAALDSLSAEIAKELGADTAAVAPPAGGAVVPAADEPGGAYGPPIAAVSGAPQSFNPDLSVIGDLLADLSPEGSTLEQGDRFQVRETEIGLQAVVDPYLRGDFFLALKGGEIELEEGYLTSLSLPHRLQARAGRFHLPFGKVNLTHRPELRTIEYPRAVQDYFGDDGFASTGLWVSKILSPLGIYQELIGVVGNDLGEGVAAEAPPGEVEEGAEDGADSGEGDGGEVSGTSGRDLLEDLADRLFLGHLKSYVDLSEAANLEVGLSAATGKIDPGDASSERLTFYGVDAIYRWRPPATALYRSLVLQSEAVWRVADAGTEFGAFGFGQVQIGRRWYLGARYDRVGRPAAAELGSENAVSGYLTLYPSEFSLFRLGLEHRAIERSEDVDRVLLQAVVTLGPHRPHAF